MGFMQFFDLMFNTYARITSHYLFYNFRASLCLEAPRGKGYYTNHPVKSGRM